MSFKTIIVTSNYVFIDSCTILVVMFGNNMKISYVYVLTVA